MHLLLTFSGRCWANLNQNLENLLQYGRYWSYLYHILEKAVTFWEMLGKSQPVENPTKHWEILDLSLPIPRKRLSLKVGRYWTYLHQLNGGYWTYPAIPTKNCTAELKYWICILKSSCFAWGFPWGIILRLQATKSTDATGSTHAQCRYVIHHVLNT